jgi:hypothetical protein
MGALKILLLIVAGFLAMVATEAGVITWMTYAPLTLDLTGNYFTLTIFPVVIVVVVVAALLLWKILAANTLRNCLVFSFVYLASETFGLVALGNPISVVATYGVIIAGVCAVVFALFSKVAWANDVE